MATLDAEPWFHDVWRRVRAQLRAEMNERYYDYWIGSLRVLSAKPELIVIACSSPFRRDQTFEKFGQRIADLIAVHVPNLGNVDFVFDPVAQAAALPPLARHASKTAASNPPAEPAPRSDTAKPTAPIGERRVLIEDIKRGVAEHFRITVRDLESPSRKRAIVRSRQIGMLLSRRITGQSFPEIARRFGDKDHSTAIHGCRKIERQSAIDPIMAAEVDALMRLFTD